MAQEDEVKKLIEEQRRRDEELKRIEEQKRREKALDEERKRGKPTDDRPDKDD